MATIYGWLSIGQSNAEPEATLADYWTLVPDLNVSLLTPDPAIDIYYGKAVKNIKFLTPYLPEQSAAYPGGSPPAPFPSYDKYALWLPWCYLEGQVAGTLLTSNVCAAGTTASSIVVAATPWSNNQFQNKFVSITSGPQSGKKRLILSNTNNTLTINPLPGAPGIGDTFQILDNRFTNPNIPGFRYPNHFGRPRGPLYDDEVPQGVFAYIANASPALDIAWRMHGLLKAPLHVVQLAIESTQLQFTQFGPGGTTSSAGKWAWYDPRVHGNWSPGDPAGLFVRLGNLLDTAKIAATNDGNTLIILGVSMLQLETDVTFADARERIADNVPKFIDAVRQAVYTRGLAEGAASQIVVVWPHIPDSPWGASNAAVANTVLDQQAADDPCLVTFDTNTFAKTNPSDAHYNAAGIRQMGAAVVSGWQAARAKLFASVSPDDLVTLQDLRDRTLREAERNSIDSGQNTTYLDEAINYALEQLYQTAGDSAFWLRYIVPTQLSSGPLAPINLPRFVGRLLEIRPTAFPTDRIDFTMLGHTDQGRVRICTQFTWSGAVDLHCMFEPRRLTGAGEKAILPRNLVEVVVVTAAHRVVQNSGNAQLETKLLARATKLMDRASGYIGKVDRQRRERMTGNRSRRYTYGSRMNRYGFGYPWTP